MRHRLYYHLVWTTKNRLPLITAPIAGMLCRLLRVIALDEQARILEIGLVQTHLHLLLTAHPQADWARLVQRLKGASSMQINRTWGSARVAGFRWEPGYSLETVSPRQVPRVREYVRNQPSHHPVEAIEGWEGDRSSEEVLR